ncbi:MAG TPA: bifunctional hydroxymethylpyrimidine kinase/phosphomethylpyrimidine kinase [Methyloceanibacter sp.]|jgi:hydroxymethylpyrimidine/phosphomethylpyrimidine kinase|nr:bifunctional hydroxymethylpyrimidine kinase/phosphomethylpyrimidine kinase [Methyloceanibacter sp.]
MTAIALTIAGSDSAGGAGIQADLKTFAALGVHGASAITALTAQNTQGVEAVHVVPPGFVLKQIEAVARDLEVGAVKIGMLATSGVIHAVAKGLDALPGVPVVLDPVMVAASGDVLLDKDAIDTLKTVLLPRAVVITPNLPEAAQFLGAVQASNEQEMRAQAQALRRLGAQAVLIKGGHATGATSIDLLLDGEGEMRLEAPRVPTKHDHGTGCTLSSAIAAELAKGGSLREAAKKAKAYVTAAIAAADELHIGKGRGPVHHFHAWWKR